MGAKSTTEERDAAILAAMKGLQSTMQSLGDSFVNSIKELNRTVRAEKELVRREPMSKHDKQVIWCGIFCIAMLFVSFVAAHHVGQDGGSALDVWYGFFGGITFLGGIFLGGAFLAEALG